MRIPEYLAKADNYTRKRLNLPLASLVFWVAYCLLLIIHCIENT